MPLFKKRRRPFGASLRVTIAAGTAPAGTLWGDKSTTGTGAVFRVRANRPGTLENIVARIQNVNLGAGDTLTVTVRKNGGGGANEVTATFVDTDAGGAERSLANLSFAAGDYLDWCIDTNDVTSALREVALSGDWCD